MPSDAFWDQYLLFLTVFSIVTAGVILISTLDDVFFDLYYWTHKVFRLSSGQGSHVTADISQLDRGVEEYLAIMVPAWHEHDVIAQMVENTLSTLEYSHYVLFLGVYRNDPQTIAEADRMVRRHPTKVHKVTVGNDGPTCKADCLNWIVRDVVEYERKHRIRFAGLIMHDSEDVIHPLEFRLFNRYVADADLIQLPVLSLERKWHEFVAGTYLDDFSESHSKDIVVRANLTGLVPGAGVASCYSRRAIELVTQLRQDNPFNTHTLTEDYDFSFRLRELGLKELFVHCPVTYRIQRSYLFGLFKREADIRSFIGAREYFPSAFRAAYRQRARWILGIAFQGWQQLGWRGGLREKYLFLHDRKALVTSFFSLGAYLISANFVAMIWLTGAGYIRLEHADPQQTLALLSPIILMNGVLFSNRIAQRVYFVSKINGIEHGLLAIPRIVVNNFINFFAASRAWKIFLLHLVTKKPIAWDKTSHTYPTAVALGETRRTLPEILIANGAIDPALLDRLCLQVEGSGRSLDHVLVEDQCVDAEVLAEAIAEAHALPRISLLNADPEQLFASFPEHVALSHKVVPFSFIGGEICVAAYAPPDEASARAIGAAAGGRVRYFIAGAHEIIAALKIRQLQHLGAGAKPNPAPNTGDIAQASTAGNQDGGNFPLQSSAQQRNTGVGDNNPETP